MAVWVGNVPDGTTAYANRACAQIGGPPVRDLSIAGAPVAYGLVTRDGKPISGRAASVLAGRRRRARRSWLTTS